ncbi:MAG: DNA repair protein RecO [Bacteroidota bacterium]
MILSTKGVVLHCKDYSETSILARVYTEQLGLQTYIAKGVRKKGARIKRNLFAPLSLIQLTANHKEGEGLRVLRDASCEYQLNGIATDMAKTAVSIYISELLTRAISAQMSDPNLYGFMEHAILSLDQASGSVSGFPLAFTIGLTQFLGFDPHNNFSLSRPYFDMVGGNFCALPPEHAYYFSTPLSSSFSEVLTALNAGVESIKVDYLTRSELLLKMLAYFRIHIPTFGELKSVRVLSEVLKD